MGRAEPHACAIDALRRIPRIQAHRRRCMCSAGDLMLHACSPCWQTLLSLNAFAEIPDGLLLSHAHLLLWMLYTVHTYFFNLLHIHSRESATPQAFFFREKPVGSIFIFFSHRSPGRKCTCAPSFMDSLLLNVSCSGSQILHIITCHITTLLSSERSIDSPSDYYTTTTTVYRKEL